MSKIRLTLDADPDVEVSDPGVRARIIQAVEHALDEDLVKSERKGPRRLPHKFPQSLIEQSVAESKTLFVAMIDEIAGVLAE